MLLERDADSVWLESENAGELLELTEPYPDELTEAYEISTTSRSSKSSLADEELDSRRPPW